MLGSSWKKLMTGCHVMIGHVPFERWITGLLRGTCVSENRHLSAWHLGPRPRPTCICLSFCVPLSLVSSAVSRLGHVCAAIRRPRPTSSVLHRHAPSHRLATRIRRWRARSATSTRRGWKSLSLWSIGNSCSCRSFNLADYEDDPTPKRRHDSPIPPVDLDVAPYAAVLIYCP